MKSIYANTYVHLGTIMAPFGSMVHDCRTKLAQYIKKTVDIRTTFSFAHPTQVLAAMDKYEGDNYGVMLYNLTLRRHAVQCTTYHYGAMMYKLPLPHHDVQPPAPFIHNFGLIMLHFLVLL